MAIVKDIPYQKYWQESDQNLDIYINRQKLGMKMNIVNNIMVCIKNVGKKIKNTIKYIPNKDAVLVSVIFIILTILLFYGGGKDSESLPKDGPKRDDENYETYVLLWNEEFDDKELNTSIWTAKNENFSIKSGNLILISEKEFYEDNNWKIYSGLIRSKDKFYFTYGYIEIKAKVVKGNGLLSAIWLTGQDRWPPEIDIIEYLGIEPISIYMTLHCNPNGDNTCVGENKSDKDKQSSIKYESDDWSQDYHIYSLEWTPDRVRWFADDIEVYNITTGVPQEPMYIVLSICAHNCGDGWSGRTDDTTPNPANFYIDYVRVYGKVDIEDKFPSDRNIIKIKES